MHRAFAAWLIASSWRAALATAILAILSPQGLSPIAVLASGVPVLLLLGLGSRSGVQAALAGCVAAGAILIASGQSILLSALDVALLFLAPLGLASLLQSTGTLRWSFQVAVVGAAALLVAIYAGVDDPVGQWRRLVQAAVEQMAQYGLMKDEQATLLGSLAHTNWGTYVALWLLTVLGSLFIGAWWHSLLNAPGAFGSEFQQLRLGKVLGTLAVLIVIAVFALQRLASIDVPVLDALLWIATIALAFQGLAAAHRLKASGRVGRGLLTTTYVLLIVPLPFTMVITVLLLAGWGVADNWRRG